jgi:hypothetical protein
LNSTLINALYLSPFVPSAAPGELQRLLRQGKLSLMCVGFTAVTTWNRLNWTRTTFALAVKSQTKSGLKWKIMSLAYFLIFFARGPRLRTLCAGCAFATEYRPKGKLLWAVKDATIGSICHVLDSHPRQKGITFAITASRKEFPLRSSPCRLGSRRVIA